ncbi:MAG TPA: hypothetical protein VKI44_14485 [Acetobacteraceae bacterium]|nr:hypothetical protein [Acetobacteraceae bacterium]
MRVIILGAAGRDFHNFNMVYRGDPSSVVVAFTAAQISGIADRTYPPALAGPFYPAGIPIVAEERLEALCRTEHVDQVVFAYSDVPHTHVMHLASRALATGADFLLLGPRHTMLTASCPVIAVSGRRVAVLRHPMPYGNLTLERVQRFGSLADLDVARCTIEAARSETTATVTGRSTIKTTRTTVYTPVRPLARMLCCNASWPIG